MTPSEHEGPDLSKWIYLNGPQLRQKADGHLGEAENFAHRSDNPEALVLAHGLAAIVAEIRACHADNGTTH